MEISYKQTLYPKTKRIGDNKNPFVITEKLDGSNLSFFSLDGELYIAQRNNIFLWNEDTNQKSLYKGLYGWLKEHGNILLENMHNGSCITGEWIGMGKINYGDNLDKRFYMFAKSNVIIDDETGKYKMVNITYSDIHFIYPFVDKNIPNFIDIVKTVHIMNQMPSIDFLDGLYDEFSRNLNYIPEGFIIREPNSHNVMKYVRFKDGKMQEHKA